MLREEMTDDLLIMVETIHRHPCTTVLSPPPTTAQERQDVHRVHTMRCYMCQEHKSFLVFSEQTCPLL